MTSLLMTSLSGFKEKNGWRYLARARTNIKNTKETAYHCYTVTLVNFFPLHIWNNYKIGLEEKWPATGWQQWKRKKVEDVQYCMLWCTSDLLTSKKFLKSMLKRFCFCIAQHFCEQQTTSIISGIAEPFQNGCYMYSDKKWMLLNI